MVTLGTRLREMRKEFRKWSPESGFTAISTHYDMADIIFGGRIASMIKGTPNHKKNIRLVLGKIKTEVSMDEKFHSWLLKKTMRQIREAVEFSYFQTPPKKQGD